MIYGLYESAAGMMVNEYRQGVLANNIANADTVGFKREIATFAERPIANEAGQRIGPSAALLERMSGGIWLGRTATDFGEGALEQTGNDYDVALAGEGFLLVRDGNGATHLTRDGRMQLDPLGRLVAISDGAEVLGPGGSPIRLNHRLGPPVIDEEGRILQRGAVVGWLALVDVADYDGLRKSGASRFALDDDVETIASSARVFQRHVESSGVEPVREMVSMLEAARAYQLNAQMVTLQDQTVARLINSVASG